MWTVWYVSANHRLQGPRKNGGHRRVLLGIARHCEQGTNSHLPTVGSADDDYNEFMMGQRLFNSDSETSIVTSKKIKSSPNSATIFDNRQFR